MMVSNRSLLPLLWAVLPLGGEGGSLLRLGAASGTYECTMHPHSPEVSDGPAVPSEKPTDSPTLPWTREEGFPMCGSFRFGSKSENRICDILPLLDISRPFLIPRTYEFLKFGSLTLFFFFPLAADVFCIAPLASSLHVITGLDRLTELVKTYRREPSTYSPTALRECLDSFREVLFNHLDQEV